MTRFTRAKEAAFVVPLFGLFLLLPPILALFDTDSTLFGIPVLHVYVFAVWFGLVAAGWWLSRRLAAGEADATGGDTADKGRPADGPD
ncbi:MAG: hypothetical protein R3F55_00640 [Alphaproteobacteria bacterium]